MSLNFVVKVQCGNDSGDSNTAVIGIIMSLLTGTAYDPWYLEECDDNSIRDNS